MHTINTLTKILPADTVTPVGIYLRLRDKYPCCVLLESSDYHSNENSLSIIGLAPLIKIEITDNTFKEYIGNQRTVTNLNNSFSVTDKLEEFFGKFIFMSKEENSVNGFLGYTSFDAIKFFGYPHSDSKITDQKKIPALCYTLYEYMVVMDHFKDLAVMIKNCLNDEPLEQSRCKLDKLISEINNTQLPCYSFVPVGKEKSELTDEEYMALVEKAKNECKKGNIFQIVLSREFSQEFMGDEFNVYRSLRSINPSPYLFYFDYGSIRIFGSSPEAQLILKNQTAEIHPIAGTVKRSNHSLSDQEAAENLKKNKKENAEHVMLVDLARNDLSRRCRDVSVKTFAETQYYSHVIHLVSKITGKLKCPKSIYKVFADTFPAGTLSGAPKYKAIQIIQTLEPSNRGYYGGAIGYITPNGTFNHAIIIRSFLSKNNTLHYRAGAGVVIDSEPENELLEVNHKLKALKEAIQKAEYIHNHSSNSI